MLRGRTIVVGVSGGIAAYKACELVRQLQLRGATVVVVMTHAATEFVTPLTFQALTGNPVVTTLWGNQAPALKLPAAAAARTSGRVEHVDVAEAADALVIAPATADLMARLVHGEAPDALTSVALASRAPLIVCPSMDLEMWRQSVTQENARALRARGATIVGPASGPLASGLVGPGRLAEIGDIVAAVEAATARRESMKGLRVLIGAGRTEEPIDPVRVLTNRSSGRMGVALAEAARARGAEVTFVAGGMSVDPPGAVALERVTTAAEMARAMTRHAQDADVVLMAAAVADFRVKKAAGEKIKRAETNLTLELAPNPDILKGLGAARLAGAGGAKRGTAQTLVGFALETSQGVARARAKLREKGVDLIVLNTPAEGIGGATNQVTLVEARTQKKLPRMSKREVAEAVLDRVLGLRGAARAPRAKPAAPATPAAGSAPGKGPARAGRAPRGRARR
jgi:phosphopantothenoylcysteine decarboxylase/phosphopantothenate--cysteine ligase